MCTYIYIYNMYTYIVIYYKTDTTGCFNTHLIRNIHVCRCLPTTGTASARGRSASRGYLKKRWAQRLLVGGLKPFETY